MQYQKTVKGLFVVTVLALAVVISAGSYAQEVGKMAKESVFLSAAKAAKIEKGTRQISYDQFIKIRNSGEKYLLLDVLAKDSYDNMGHIEGSLSFPLTDIDKKSAQARLSKSDHIVVYCGSFQCTASTAAAKELSKLGYDVLDYKGGLKEWQEKGNGLVKG
jgi:rhodanese-related sulfurtransferase